MSVIPLRVAVRVRPLIPKEVDEGCQTCLTYMPEEQQIILGKDRSFTYDFVFKPTDPQISVYEEIVQSLIKHIFKGYNATVLAYGQTGSGKTFTMGGGYEASLSMDPEGMGIIPRIVQELFTIMADKEDYDFTVNVSYLEIINEELQDLLVTGKKDSMTIREENGEIKIPKLREVPVTSVEATMKCLQLGCGNRTTAATAMNSTSSRSHAIFTLSIESKHKEESNDYWKAKLQLVDLAGSERIKKTHAEGERLKEGININKGLLSLGNVISVLGDENNKKAHIPYRDSKLTRILQDSLGGNSHTLMIACVSPADSNMEETLNTLRYADRARKIKNKPVVNWDPKTAEIMNLKAKVQELTMKLIQSGMSDLAEQAISRAPMPVPSSPGRNKELAEKVEKLMKQCQQLEEELQVSVDQAASASERAIKWEMRCERLKERLRELEQSIGVDFDLLSSSLVDGNPVITDQLDKLRNFAARLNESLTTDGSEENDCIFEEKDPDLEDVADETMDGLPGPSSYAAAATPESQEMAIQHTRRRARLNTELQELNKILEHKERLANQFSRNDNKMAELKEQYEGNMKSLEEKIGSLEKEKDNLSTALEGARANQAANKVSEQRRKKLQELETRMGDLRKQLTEQRKVLKLKEQKEKEVLKMNSEIVTLKQHRVKLMKQMKEDADTWRKFKQQKDKEVLQLQQKDRKKQFQIQKLQRENERTQNVLQRKSEEAAVANRRLKEAVLKQKKVIEERSSKFDKYDNTAIGNRVKKWLSHELDVKVGIIEVKYHRENLIQDRKTLANQLKSLKDDSDASQDDDFHSKIQHLENQIELRNVQISDLQQKILDAEQEGKGKSVKDNLHTMMEAKIALKWLLDQAVSYKAANDRVKMDLTDLRETVQEDKSENEEYIEQLEEKIEALKKEHTSTVMEMQMAMQNDHQQEIKILLASVGAQAADVDVVKRLETQNSEICRLKEVNEMLQLKAERMENHLTKYMWQDKSICLLPPVARLPEDEKLTEDQRSPFLSPRPKIAMPELLREADKQYKRRKTALFEQPDELKLKEKRQSGGCGCTGNCKTNRCNCRKNKQFCSAMCNCKSCENEEVQLPESTTTSDQEQTTSSVMNSTFEVEPSREENDDDSSSRSSTENKPVIGAGPKKAGKPPKAPKFSRQTSHSVLSTIQTPSDYRSSDEFEKPKLLRKSVSAGMLRKKRSSARLSGAEAKDSSAEAESGEEVSTMLDSFAKKKRRLNNPTKNYFGSIDSS